MDHLNMKLKKNGTKTNKYDKLIKSKLRSKNKVQNRRIEALEKRVQELVGMNDELEMMLSQYEREEVSFQNVPKHLQLDEIF